jgi:hypothetical protein
VQIDGVFDLEDGHVVVGHLRARDFRFALVA